MEYNLNELLGFGVSQVESCDGSTVFAIDTPFCFFDGDPLTVFFQKLGDTFFLFDEGLSLFQSRIAGIPTYKKMRNYKKRAMGFDLFLGDDGEISTYANDLTFKRKFTSLMHFILTLDRETRQFLEEKPSSTNLKEQIQMYYRLWKPEESFEDNPRIYAANDLSCSFNMRFGKTFIDGFIPNSEHTGSFLRKAAILRQSDFVDAESLAVIDDSIDKELARKELGNISVMSKGMLLSSLETKAANSQDRLFA